MVKAGLLPRLAKSVLPVYIEATADETKVRLVRGLHKACPDLPADRSLVDTMAALRRGRVLASGQKVLLVLDQFERSLSPRRGRKARSWSSRCDSAMASTSRRSSWSVTTSGSKGYRLPTEAEWEYACRSGAGTDRHFGANIDLLGRYGWYLATSQDHVWRCGGLLPNDLGLFDILGNVLEWCQDQPILYRPDRSGIIVDSVNKQLHINTNRLLRGGAFNLLPAHIRSAGRGYGARRNAAPTSVSASPELSTEHLYKSSGRRPNPRLRRGGALNNQLAHVRFANSNSNAPTSAR